MHLLALHLGAVADADDVELALEAVGHAGHGVGDQAARQAVELAELRVVGRALRHAAWPSASSKLMPAGSACRSLPFGPCTSTAPSAHLDGDALGNRDRFLSNSRHCLISRLSLPLTFTSLLSRYQMLQSTSPPTPALTASRPVITPRDVVRMLVPRPASTSGTSSRPK